MRLKKFFLNIYFWPAFAVVTLAALLLFVLLLPCYLLFARRCVPSALRRGIRVYGWVLIRIVPFMAPVKIEDHTGDIPYPVIYTPNHFSSVDPYLFGLVPREIAFITSWPYRIPIINRIMRLAGYIDAEKGWKEVQEQGCKLIKAGCSLLIWPEGHRSRDRSMGRFRNGAFQLACRTRTPVVPVCIVGSNRLLPPHSRLLTPQKVKIVLLPPVHPPHGEGPNEVYELKKKIRKSIAKELEKYYGGTTPVKKPLQVINQFQYP